MRLSNAALAAEVTRLGINWTVSDADASPKPQPTPKELIIALASSDEARLRLALIPLFLTRPDYATATVEAAEHLVSKPRVTLICYYTAAYLLQRKYAERLEGANLPLHTLPDCFSGELEVVPSGEPDAVLAMLARRQADLTGRALNWYGTYEQAAERLLKRSQLDLAWASH